MKQQVKTLIFRSIDHHYFVMFVYLHDCCFYVFNVQPPTPFKTYSLGVFSHVISVGRGRREGNMTQ